MDVSSRMSPINVLIAYENQRILEILLRSLKDDGELRIEAHGIPSKSVDSSDFFLRECAGNTIDIFYPTDLKSTMFAIQNLRVFRDHDIEPIIPVSNPELLDIIVNESLWQEYLSDVLQLDPHASRFTNKILRVPVLCRKGTLFGAIPLLEIPLPNNQVLLSNYELSDILYELCENIVAGFGLSYCVELRLSLGADSKHSAIGMDPTYSCPASQITNKGVNIPLYSVQMALRRFDYNTRISLSNRVEAICSI